MSKRKRNSKLKQDEINDYTEIKQDRKNRRNTRISRSTAPTCGVCHTTATMILNGQDRGTVTCDVCESKIPSHVARYTCDEHVVEELEENIWDRCIECPKVKTATMHKVVYLEQTVLYTKQTLFTYRCRNHKKHQEM